MDPQCQPLAEPEYRAQATATDQQLVATVEQPAQHLGIRRLQEIFREHPDPLYHWVADHQVSPNNSRCEPVCPAPPACASHADRERGTGRCELRPTVIAHTVSFGSQSEARVQTREILLSVPHSLRKRRADAQAQFKGVPDQPATNPEQDRLPLLFSPIDSS